MIYLELVEEGFPVVDYTSFTDPHICLASKERKLNAYLKYKGNKLTLFTSDPYQRDILVLDLADPASFPNLFKELRQWQNPSTSQSQPSAKN